MGEKIGVIILILLLPICVWALEKPSGKTVQSVMAYYSGGQDGAVLVETKICRAIGESGPEKNNCIEDISGQPLQVGEDAYIWMNFLVPVDTQAKIYLSFTRDKRIRKTEQFTLDSAFRYRTWKKLATDSPGEWQITVFQEMDDRDIDLGTITYMVSEVVGGEGG